MIYNQTAQTYTIIIIIPTIIITIIITSYTYSDRIRVLFGDHQHGRCHL